MLTCGGAGSPPADLVAPGEGRPQRQASSAPRASGLLSGAAAPRRITRSGSVPRPS